jgi:hypothetical protein
MQSDIQNSDTGMHQKVDKSFTFTKRQNDKTSRMKRKIGKSSDTETKCTDSEESQRSEVPKRSCVINQHQPDDDGESDVVNELVSQQQSSGNKIVQSCRNKTECGNKNGAKAGLVDAAVERQQQAGLISKPVDNRNIGVEEYHPTTDLNTLNNAQDVLPVQARGNSDESLQRGKHLPNDTITDISLINMNIDSPNNVRELDSQKINLEDIEEGSSTNTIILNNACSTIRANTPEYGVKQEVETTWVDNNENEARTIYNEKVESQQIENDIYEMSITGYEDGQMLAQGLHDTFACLTLH